jgi:hypothetical protein
MEAMPQILLPVNNPFLSIEGCDRLAVNFSAVYVLSKARYCFMTDWACCNNSVSSCPRHWFNRLLSKVIGSIQTSKLSTARPFSGEAGTETTAGDNLGSLGRAEVKGNTVTLLRLLLKTVPEIINPGLVLRISVPTEGSKFIIQMLPSL